MKTIPSLPGYLAGEDGHIYSTRAKYGATAPRQLAERPTHDGYLRVRVVKAYAEPVRSQAVAPIVAEAYLGPRPEGQQVRHLNGVKTDNRPANLAYGTALDNARDRDGHGSTCRGERSRQARHTDAQVREAVERVLAGEPRALVAHDVGISKSGLARWVTGQQRRDAHPVRTWVAA